MSSLLAQLLQPIWNPIFFRNQFTLLMGITHYCQVDIILVVLDSIGDVVVVYIRQACSFIHCSVHTKKEIENWKAELIPI